MRARGRWLALLLVTALFLAAGLPAAKAATQEKAAADIDIILALDVAGTLDLKGPNGSPLMIHRLAGSAGRGAHSKGEPEPDYIGVLGYAALQTGWDVTRFNTFVQTPWQLPWYEEDEKGSMKVANVINHKTPVLVFEQKIHESFGYSYTGYLHVARLDTFETGWIDVTQFVTVAYWKMELSEARKYGYCIAAYREKSRFLPMDGKGRRGPLPDGERVLLVDWKSSSRYTTKDKENNPYLGIIFRDSKDPNAYYRTFLHFNPEDLTLIY